MLKTIDAQNNIYQLIIEYQGKEYKYKANLIQTFAGEQRWHIHAANKRMLFLIYNTALKTLREDLQHGQRSIPVEFLQVIEKSFQQKK